MAKVVGVGIIGAGRSARTHAKGFGMFPQQCRLVAFADVREQKAHELRDEFGAPDAYADYRRMLAREDIDLVSVCTPPAEHCQPVVDALQAGKCVLCEKPLAGSLQECDRMIAAARASGRALAVVMQNRYGQDFRRVKALVDSGRMGRLLHARAECLWWRGAAYYDVDWRGKWAGACGGATLNQAIHYLDLLAWIVGSPRSVIADLATTLHRVEVEDLSVAVVRFENGVVAECTASTASHCDRGQFGVYGEKAGIEVPGSVVAHGPSASGFDPVDDVRLKELEEFLRERVPVSRYQGHAAVIEEILGAVRDRRPLSVPGDEGRRSVELATGIYAAARTGCRVGFPIGPESPFYTREGILRAATGG